MYQLTYEHMYCSFDGPDGIKQIIVTITKLYVLTKVCIP